jgi:hypothetical protein
MSAFPRHALTAIAFQLVAELEEYQAAYDRLVTGPASLEQSRLVSGKLDELLMLKGALPQLSVQMVELLVCHTELMHVLWGAMSATPEERADLVERHRDATRAMRAKCVRLFCRSAA